MNQVYSFMPFLMDFDVVGVLIFVGFDVFLQPLFVMLQTIFLVITYFLCKRRGREMTE
jgi:hypothetical protein